MYLPLLCEIQTGLLSPRKVFFLSTLMFLFPNFSNLFFDHLSVFIYRLSLVGFVMMRGMFPMLVGPS